jgi:biopolymer transport protein TolR
MPLTRARLKISDYNESRKNRLRTQERRIYMVSLSLTSMVDMFAILVIFLLVNASSVSQWIEVSHNIQLPTSKFSEKPEEASTLELSTEAVFGGKVMLMTIGGVKANESLKPLSEWLKSSAAKKGLINVVAHQDLPYGVIRRVVALLKNEGYNNINLAVQPRH